MTETFRAGWHVHRPSNAEVWRLHEPAPPYVTVRRGEWQMQIPIQGYDEMTDDQFAEVVAYTYRESAFGTLQEDLDTLARQLIGEIEMGALPETDVPYDDVKAALYRWQKAKRDTQPRTEKPKG